MKQMFSNCREVRRNLLRIDALDAVERGFMDMHMKRCSVCRDIAQGLALIEAGPGEIEEISEERIQNVYRRLIPAVHEISTQMTQPKKSWSFLKWRSAYAMGVAFVFACVVAGVFLFQNIGEQTTGVVGQPTITRVVPSEDLSIGFVDRCEGRVRIDGEDIFGEKRFSLRGGTQIEVDKDARFSFHVGNLVRVALFGKTTWRLVEAQEDRVVVYLDSGRLAVDFNSQYGKALTVTTRDATVRVRGTIFTVEALTTGHTSVGVIEGRVNVVSHRAASRTISVGVDQAVTVPGNGEFESVTDAQRSLVAELSFIGQYPEELTRMVRFDGSPEKARVEVEGRVVGTTPLAVRVPEGPFTYKLTAPGMEPVVGTTTGYDSNEQIAFAMLPAYDYQPAAVRHTSFAGKKRRASRLSDETPRTTSRKSMDLYERARSAMTAGDIPHAIALLERANETVDGKKLVTGLALLAECYAALGIYHKAADVLDSIVEEMPNSAVAQNARYEIGRLAMDQLGDYSRAKGAFTAYVASRIGGELKEDAYYSLCELDGRRGEHRNALHCFNQFLISFSEGRYEPSARLWRGALYQDVEGRFADAERDLLSFIKARPRHPRTDEARYRVALGRYQGGDKRGAMRMIREYLRHHPNGKYRLRAERLRLAIIDPSVSLQTEK
jgi:tetratricopeptide (TPR) repeat protein